MKQENTDREKNNSEIPQSEERESTIFGISSIKVLFALEYVLQGLANPFLGITYQPFYNHLRYHYGLTEALTQSYVSRIYLAWSFKPLIGFFIDAYGKTRTVLIFLLFFGTLLYFFTPFLNIPVNIFFGIMFTISILFACTDVAVDRATVIEGDEEAKSSGRSKAAAIGLNQAICWAAIYGTSIFSASCGGWVAEHIEIKYLLYMLGLVPLTVLLVTLRLPKDKKISIPLRESAGNFWSALNTGPVLWIILFYFLFKFQPSLGTIWLYHLIENLHYTQTQIGYCEAFNHVGHFLGVLLFVWAGIKWQDKLGFRNLFRAYIFVSILLNLSQYLLVEPAFGRIIAFLDYSLSFLSIEFIRMFYLSAYNFFSGLISATILMSTISLVGAVIPVNAAGSLFAGFMSVANLARSFSYSSGAWLYTSGLNYGIFCYLQEKIFALSAVPGEKMSINLLIFIGSIAYFLSFLSVHMLPDKKRTRASEVDDSDMIGPKQYAVLGVLFLKVLDIITLLNGFVIFFILMWNSLGFIESSVISFFIPTFMRKIVLDFSYKRYNSNLIT